MSDRNRPSPIGEIISRIESVRAVLSRKSAPSPEMKALLITMLGEATKMTVDLGERFLPLDKPSE